MKKSVFVNDFKFFIISFCLSLFFCGVMNRPMLSYDINFEMFREVNGGIYGYSSLQSYFLIYLPAFFVLLNFFIRGEKDYKIIRLKSKRYIAAERTKLLFKTVVIVFVPHFFVQVIFNFFVFYKSSFLNVNYFFSEIMQIISVMSTFLILGLCFGNIMLYFKSEISLIIVLLISILYYFINRIFLNYVLLRELCIKELILEGNYHISKFFVSIIKYIILIYVLINFMLIKLREVDVYEK